VRSQIWCAIATYVLIAIVKKELKLDASLYTCLHLSTDSVGVDLRENRDFMRPSAISPQNRPAGIR
jgi:hypothetical protein